MKTEIINKLENILHLIRRSRVKRRNIKRFSAKLDHFIRLQNLMHNYEIGSSFPLNSLQMIELKFTVKKLKKDKILLEYIANLPFEDALRILVTESQDITWLSQKPGNRIIMDINSH
jgi:hypothetical protein